MSKLPLISALFFSALIALCVVLLVKNNIVFMDSLFPEVFGFALDGLILFSGVTLVQIWISKRDKEEKNSVLIASLREIAGGYLSFCYLVALEHGQNPEESRTFDVSQDAIDNMSKMFSGVKIEDDKDSVKELVEYVNSHKSTIAAALPVAAQISPAATSSWSAFLTHINNIDSEDSNYGPSIHNSLQSLKRLNHANS